MSEETGRPIEIEITDEMVEAGISAIDPLDYGLISPSEKVSAIFSAMYLSYYDRYIGIPYPLSVR